MMTLALKAKCADFELVELSHTLAEPVIGCGFIVETETASRGSPIPAALGIRLRNSELSDLEC